MGKVIGIDLGTTNSVVAVMEGGEPVVIPNAEGGRTTPSVVAFTKDGERLVGQVARRQAITNPENTIFSIKRFMGRKHGEVTEEEKLVPYEVGPEATGRVQVTVKNADKTFTPPEISAMILQKMKQTAEDYLGAKVTQAVITVPAYFNDAQRQATKDAGKIAGLEVLRIINEPTAAALAYGLDKKKDEKIAVFDLGGGTFDISILELGDGVFEVKSTNGDTHLGGDDFDQRVIDWLVDEFKKDQGIDLSQGRHGAAAPQGSREKAKMELSTTMTTDINLPFITATQDGPKHLNYSAHPGEVRAARRRPDRADHSAVQKALEDAGLTPDEIDEVILVGGSTRIPKVQEVVKEFFGKEPHRGVNPDEVVARRRGHPGRRARRRREGRAAARRDAALARHRDAGRRHDDAHRAEHDDPDQEGRDLLDRRGQPDRGRDPRAPGRARDGRRQQDDRPVPAHGDSAGAARHAADRGHVRHRRERHPARVGEGQGDGQGAEDPHRGLERALGRRDRPDGEGRRGARRRGQGAPRARSRPATSSTRWSTRSRRTRRSGATRSRGGPRSASRRPWTAAKKALKGDDLAPELRP